MQYSIIKNEEGTSFITVVIAGRKPLVADSSHANWDAILDGVLAEDDSVADLFDLSATAAARFERLSDRVSVANGRVYFDGDEVHNTLADQIVRFIEEGDDFRPLVKFYENLASNPNEHSVEQLYNWLATHDFTIDGDGMVVGYKGVRSDGKGGFESVHQGKAIVNGETVQGNIPNPIGAIIEMPRSEVHHDPSQGCSTGLHIGTYEYATGYTHSGVMLEVRFNPRDVVSVPTESDWAKVRVCRYEVIRTLDAPYSSSLIDYEGEDEDYDGDWGDGEGEEVPTVAPWYVGNDLLVKDAGVYRGDVFVDRDSRRLGRTLTVENVDVDNNVASCRSSSSGKVVNVSIDRLLSRKYDRR